MVCCASVLVSGRGRSPRTVITSRTCRSRSRFGGDDAQRYTEWWFHVGRRVDVGEKDAREGVVEKRGVDDVLTRHRDTKREQELSRQPNGCEQQIVEVKTGRHAHPSLADEPQQRRLPITP